MSIKVCPNCKISKPFEDFGMRKDKPHLAKGRCKTCHAELAMVRYVEQRTKINAQRKRRRQENPDYKRYPPKRKYHLQRYGLTDADYHQMLVKQNHVCAICKEPEVISTSKSKGVIALSVDHCHASGKVRGLLCNRCNTTLGKIGDSKEWLRTAESYLAENTYGIAND